MKPIASRVVTTSNDELKHCVLTVADFEFVVSKLDPERPLTQYLTTAQIREFIKTQGRRM
jgi:hypothetical protein